MLKLFFILSLTSIISCRNLREKMDTSLTTAKMDPPTDTPQDLYRLLDTYRESEANIYNDLITSSTTENGLYGMAETEVTSMLTEYTFGEHTHFKENSKLFAGYSEIICILVENHNGKAYEAAFDLWKTDAEIIKDFKQEYILADANCQGYGNGWMCALLLAAN